MLTLNKDTKMLIGGKWVNKEKKIKVLDPQNEELITEVPMAEQSDILLSIENAEEGASIASKMPVYERINILNKAADYIYKHKDMYSRTIAAEGSKTINEAHAEVSRSIQTIRLSAEEARRITGETIPFDQMPGSENRVGYYYKFPVGIVAAITPFNDPLNLVAHKVGPAIASGNAIIVKPSSLTPISALLLAEAFVEAGLPEKILSVITGSGKEIGNTLVSHPSIKLISFTGGYETGKKIAEKAGLKKISMELGSNSPTIILEDADLTKAVESTVAGSFGAAGQNCIGVQRIFVEQSKYNYFLNLFIEATKKLQMGDKKSSNTDIGPLISENEAIRIEKMVNEVTEKYDAKVLVGGFRNKAFYAPTILIDVPINSTIAKEEIFGPVVMVFPISNLEEGIKKSNEVDYGLQAGIFTQNISSTFHAIRELNYGGVMLNDSSDYRIDSMPFGGTKKSGVGREGVKYTIEDMTETKVVQFKL